MNVPQTPNRTRTLPERPELQYLRKQSKLLLKAFRANDDLAIAEVNEHYRDALATTFRLSDAQLVLARSYGFTSWPKLVAHVYSLVPPTPHEPLHYKDVFQAAKGGDCAKIRAMLDSDEAVLDIADNNQSTPLTVAFASITSEFRIVLDTRLLTTAQAKPVTTNIPTSQDFC